MTAPTDTATPGTDSTAPGAPNPGTATQTPAATPAAQPAAVPAEWDGKVESLPTAAQQLMQRYKDEAATASSKARENARAEAKAELLKSLGLTKDGDEIPDPEKLAAQLASKDAQLRNLLVETAAGRAARTAGADVDALLDSRQFAAKLESLDPGAADFQTQLDSLVKSTVDANPSKFKAARAAGSSGIEITGGPGDEGQITEEQLKNMTPEQIVEAHAKGLTKNLL